MFLVLPEGEENFIRSPVGDLKSFILPEGEENFIRSPVGDLKSFIGRRVTEIDIQEGLRKIILNFFSLLQKIPSSQRWVRRAAE